MVFTASMLDYNKVLNNRGVIVLLSQTQVYMMNSYSLEKRKNLTLGRTRLQFSDKFSDLLPVSIKILLTDF